MGDRANVYVHDGAQPGVYLYTHWSGSELPETVRQALASGRDRWTDDPYLARIIAGHILDTMLDGDRGTTGFGISAYVTDGADRIVDVNTANRRVTLTGYGDLFGPKEQSFEEFVKTDRR